MFIYIYLNYLNIKNLFFNNSISSLPNVETEVNTQDKNLLVFDMLNINSQTISWMSSSSNGENEGI